jgi:SAM-dependent methyltransferase
MRTEVLEFLACPDCQSPVALTAGPSDPDGHIMSGELVCGARGCRYQIVEGVPVMRPASVEPVKSETAARFDTQWKHWTGIHAYYERQFLDWIAPVQREDFVGRAVLEGGCGKGRHSVVVSGFAPRALVALDLGESAYVAFSNTRELPNVHVVIGDLTQPPVAPVFDLAFSVGVLHHLPDPAAGFRSLSSRVREGGTVVAWVYGQENNEWIVRYVDPVRNRMTSRMPPALLRAVSALPATALWAVINGVYARANGFAGRLPYAEYFASLRGFPLREIHNIVFDQLVTPVAFYLPEQEVRSWFAEGFCDVTVRWKGKYSWTGVATVARAAAS